MMHRMIAFILLASLLGCGGQAFAGGITPEARLTQLFTVEPMNAEWFSPAFLAQVPITQMQAIVQQYRDALGNYERAEGAAPAFNLIFSKGTAPCQVVLDNEGRIAGFWLGLPQPKASDIADTLASFAALPGQVSVLVATEKQVLGSINPDAQLAVGSAFKLAVLAALKDQVASGALAWDDVVTLADKHVSLPSGVLQAWPIGTPLTIQTVASLMVSISDNTATDLLIDTVGKASIEAYTLRNRPFLSTREAFALKNPANAALLAAYRQGDIQGKRSVLQSLGSAPLPSASLFSGNPVALDIEWYFSVSELANLMAHVQDLPFMSINPGIASAKDWKRIAYKGGSEPGVLNMTTWLLSNSGKSYVVSATWNNNEPLDETRFMLLYGALLAALCQVDAASE